MTTSLSLEHIARSSTRIILLRLNAFKRTQLMIIGSPDLAVRVNRVLDIARRHPRRRAPSRERKPERADHDRPQQAGDGTGKRNSPPARRRGVEREIMAQAKQIGEYPPDWDELAELVNGEADYKCVRCNHVHAPADGYCLTVHHFTGDKCCRERWCLMSLCQRCHLSVQARSILKTA